MNNKEEEKLNRLLQKYLAGKATPEEEGLLTAWYENLDNLGPFIEPIEEQVNRQKRRNWVKLNAALEKTDNRIIRKTPKFQLLKLYRRNRVWVGIAAVLVVFFGMRLYSTTKAAYPSNVAGKTYQNNTAEVQRISLADGTLVWLEPEASIKYPLRFNAGTREIYFTGKAFFSVARDSQHPFLVHGPAVRVKVLGTSFSLDFNKENKAAEVAVRSGKVTVTPTEKNVLDFLPFRPAPDETLYLVRNEQAQYKQRILKKSKMKPNYWKNQIPKTDLSFHNTPLEKVIRQLEDQYRVSIHLNDTELKKSTLTAYFKDQPLELKLQMISKSIGATYKKINDKFVITNN